MPKALIDTALVTSAACPPGRSKLDFYDLRVRGYILEVRPGGKTFAFRYKDLSGRQCQYKIAKAEDLTPAAARKQAEKLRSRVATGDYPGAAKAEARSVPLFRELATLVLEDAKLHLKSYPTMEACMRVHVAARWGKTRLTEITPRGVSQWLAEKRAAGSSPATVEKMRVILGRCFVLGASWEVPGCDKNPTRGVARKPLNNARTRFLSAEEAERLRKAAAGSQNTQLLPIISLLLLTGARVRELLEAKWTDVDVTRRSWFISEGKTGSRHVPLSSSALNVIANLQMFKDCPYILPNPNTGKPFVSIKHSFDRARTLAKLPGVRIHDLRHSAASYMVNAGVDLFAVGKVLGHASYQSTQRYAHLANDTLLAAVEAGAAKQVC